MYSTLQSVLPKNKDVLLQNHSAIITLRKAIMTSNYMIQSQSTCKFSVFIKKKIDLFLSTQDPIQVDSVLSPPLF